MRYFGPCGHSGFTPPGVWAAASGAGRGLGAYAAPPRPLDLAVATQEATDNDST